MVKKILLAGLIVWAAARLGGCIAESGTVEQALSPVAMAYTVN